MPWSSLTLKYGELTGYTLSFLCVAVFPVGTESLKVFGKKHTLLPQSHCGWNVFIESELNC